MAPLPTVLPPHPPLTDGRVVLRAPRESDLRGLLEDGRDPETQRWVNVPRPYTERAAREELDRFLAWWDDPTAPFPLVIADVGSDAYLGAVNRAPRRAAAHRRARLVHPRARGRGVGTGAVRLAAIWAFAALGAERLEARTDPENVASQRLLARAGFTRETNGVRGDMVCWSLLPGDLTEPARAG